MMQTLIIVLAVLFVAFTGCMIAICRIEAEEERIHAEAKAKRAAKKAERKKKREIENLAKQIADAYHEQELLEEAEELATKKYGVPKVYLDSHNTCSCGCCEELGTMTDEDVTD